MRWWLAALPAGDGTHPDGPVPTVGKEPPDVQVRVVPVPVSDSGASLQELPGGSARESYCGRKHGARLEEPRVASRSGTPLQRGGAAIRSWTSSPPRMWRSERPRVG